MSDYHEMFESWSDAVREYDPDYPIDGGRDNDDNKPVNPDGWADNGSDFEGGM